MNTYSYTKIDMFNKCPFKYYKKYILKEDQFSDSPIFEKGRFIHALLEHYPLLPEFKFKFKDIAGSQMDLIESITEKCRNDKKLRFLLSPDVKIAAEKYFYLDPAFQECKKPDALFTGIIDYVGRVDNSIILVDWKSGQTQKHATVEQLKFYSTWAFTHFPGITSVKLYLYFVEQNIYVHEEIDLAMCKAIQEHYINKVDVIENTKVFDKKRSGECTYCTFQKECIKIKIDKEE